MEVIGSSPILSTYFNGGVRIIAVPWPVKPTARGQNPYITPILFPSSVKVARLAVNQLGGGASPSSGANFKMGRYPVEVAVCAVNALS